MKKALLLVFALLGTAIILAPQTSAASGFNAGRIIDDSVFTNKSSMSVSDIQSFLNSKVTACDTSGSQQSEMNNSGVPDYNGNGSIQRWEWGKYKYDQTSFPCLRDYKQDNISAAQLIYNAAQNYSINPQTLIVLLQKEQGLVTDTWPLNIQYRSATGYGCPDTAACDSKYYGLKNQIDWASKMFRAILDNSPNWYTPYVLGNNYIQYSPDSSCGGSTVNIQNRSTQALYNYTPYQPNQAALDAGWGTANCGAYGNRNFYLYFTNWFGSTQMLEQFTTLSDPRWLQLNKDIRKINPLTGEQVDDILLSGRQIEYTSKILLNGEWCLRTESDTRNNYNKCIPISATNELSITYSPVSGGKALMEITTDSRKDDLRRSRSAGDVLEKSRQIEISASTTAKNTDYYVTDSDQRNGYEYGIPKNRLIPSPTYIAIEPIWLELKSDSNKVSPLSGDSTSETLPSGMRRQYTSKAFVNDQWYYRTESDTRLLLNKAIPESQLQSLTFENFSSPRWMTLNGDATKMDLSTGSQVGNSNPAGTQFKFTSKTQLNGITYYRTDADTSSNNTYAIPANKVIDLTYEKFSSPRNMILNKDAPKYFPSEAKIADTPFTQGLTRRYTSKINVNGTWYYRTETDEASGINKAFRAADLSEVQ